MYVAPDHQQAAEEAADKAKTVRLEIATKQNLDRLERGIERLLKERRSFGEPKP